MDHEKNRKKSKINKKRSIGAPAVSIDLVGNLPTKPSRSRPPQINHQHSHQYMKNISRCHHHRHLRRDKSTAE
jgi:hypothetical protein